MGSQNKVYSMFRNEKIHLKPPVKNPTQFRKSPSEHYRKTMTEVLLFGEKQTG